MDEFDDAIRMWRVRIEQFERILAGPNCNPATRYARELIEEKQKLEGEIAVVGRIREARLQKMATHSETLFTHAPDYRSVSLRGQRYSLTTQQAQVVEMLHTAHESGNPELSGAYIMERLGTPGSRLRDTFKTNRSAWEALIVPGKTKGAHRLNF
jgi:hypothetical protein